MKARLDANLKLFAQTSPAASTTDLHAKIGMYNSLYSVAHVLIASLAESKRVIQEQEEMVDLLLNKTASPSAAVPSQSSI